jgi:hypothetical protein
VAEHQFAKSTCLRRDFTAIVTQILFGLLFLVVLLVIRLLVVSKKSLDVALNNSIDYNGSKARRY